MNKILALTMTAGLATAGAQGYSANFNNVELGLSAGYQGGLSGGVTAHARNVIGAFGLRLGADYTVVADALNDNAPLIPGGLTFGSIKQSTGATESGRSATVGLDVTYDLGTLGAGLNTYVYAGPRYNAFSASTSQGNNTSTYTVNQFGLGAGVAAGYALANNLTLTGDLGVDYFFPGAAINTDDGQGNTDSFARGEGGYSDLDTLVNQPTTSFKAKIGLSYKF